MAQTIDQPAADGAPPTHHRMSIWLVLVGAVVMLSGLLFGYDQGVISGALNGIKQEFDLGTTAVEIVTSWVTLGALVGALIAGAMADRFGRKRTVLTAAVLFTIGAIVEATAPSTPVLVIGRLIVGFGVGVASVAAPLYAAELAPARLRGRFVSMYQLAITIGIFAAYAVDQALAGDDWWRLMLGVSAVPAILLAVAVFPTPPSPRFLMMKGRRTEAAEVLHKVEPDIDVDAELDLLAAAVAADADQASWSELLTPALRRPLYIGVGLAVFQQITGINAIIYYANEIFAAAGFATPADQAAATTWAIGAVNVVATFIAVAYVDRFGRRPLLLAGLVGMGVSLATVGFCFLALDDGGDGGSQSAAAVITLIALVIFIASFAFSLGPVVWTVINEIFPGRVRGRGVAVATAANWGSAFLVSQFFLSLTDWIGQSGTFWLFAFFAAVAFVWVWRTVPETKGKTLEEIEQMLAATDA